MEKKLDGNYTRMLRAILNKSWQQHPTRRQLYCHLPPVTKTIQARRTRHAGHCWRSKDEIVSDVLLWTPAYDQSNAGRSARTYSSYVMIRDVTLKTRRRRWMIGRRGERGSGISVLAARNDDDDDDDDIRYRYKYCEMGGKWPYGCCFVGCCLQDLFITGYTILEKFLSSFLSKRFVWISVVPL